MAKFDKLALKVRDKYCFLSFLNRDNELLKYYVLKPYGGEIGFMPNPNKKIKDEFLERFRGDFPTRDFLRIERRIEISSEEYGSQLASFLVQNYCNALEREIKLVEMRN